MDRVSVPARRVGLFGGTFDPPHLGHLILAELAAETLALDCVLFAPTAKPPHKPMRSTIDHRVAMVQQAIADNPVFCLSLVDVHRPPPYYSVDSVALVQDQHPDAEIFFMMGGDSFRDLPQWHRPADLMTRCTLAVMRRPSFTPVMAHMHDDVLPSLSDRVIMLEAPPIGISSTRIAEQVRAGRSVRYLVPDVVRHYIHDHKLYKVAQP